MLYEVITGRTEATARGEADHERALGLAAEHIAELPDLVDDLVHAHADSYNFV